MRGASIVLLGLVLAPLAASAGSVHVVDAEGDQDFEPIFWWYTRAPVFTPFVDAGYPDGCDDPATDVVDVELAHDATTLLIFPHVADAGAPVRCAGVDVPRLETLAGFPRIGMTFRRVLPDGTTAPGFAFSEYRTEDGTLHRCLSYQNPPPTVRVCQDVAGGSPVEFPLVHAADGRVMDIRGHSYELTGSGASSYGVNDPKSNVLTFWEWFGSDGQAILTIPSG